MIFRTSGEKEDQFLQRTWGPKDCEPYQLDFVFILLCILKWLKIYVISYIENRFVEYKAVAKVIVEKYRELLISLTSLVIRLLLKIYKFQICPYFLSLLLQLRFALGITLLIETESKHSCKYMAARGLYLQMNSLLHWDGCQPSIHFRRKKEANEKILSERKGQWIKFEVLHFFIFSVWNFRFKISNSECFRLECSWFLSNGRFFWLW